METKKDDDDDDNGSSSGSADEIGMENTHSVDMFVHVVIWSVNLMPARARTKEKKNGNGLSTKA